MGLLHACQRMRFSRRVQYAICGIFDLAYNGAGEPVRVRAIGERQQIPYRFLEQIFQSLRRADLVRGKRGPGGGYVLTRPPEEISLREVVEAVEGPLGELALRDLEEAGGAPHRPDFLWRGLAERIAQGLGEVALSEVCREAVRQGVARDLPGGFDYQI
ncbi:MAG: Rrf2 family transcriptional regulator [Deltaproteobacteria bacterium]|nr:Rrf2 family transcriptional regulator [Deltaproteobacteria bacterium]